jgi:hypothetical protein
VNSCCPALCFFQQGGFPILSRFVNHKSQAEDSFSVKDLKQKMDTRFIELSCVGLIIAKGKKEEVYGIGHACRVT